MSFVDPREVFAKTVYAEARSEGEGGWKAVAWVIKNRAEMNRPYWGGNQIANVCLHPDQFECWNGRNDIAIHDPQTYQNIRRVTDQIYASGGFDPTYGANYYNNPAIQGYPAWTGNCDVTRTIGNHVFYRGH